MVKLKPVSYTHLSYVNKYIDENELEISLDFLPSITSDEISKLIRENPNKNVINNLKGLLPQNFLKEIFNLLDLTDKKANELSKSDELKIVEVNTCFSLLPLSRPKRMMALDIPIDTKGMSRLAYWLRILDRPVSYTHLFSTPPSLENCKIRCAVDSTSS